MNTHTHTESSVPGPSHPPRFPWTKIDREGVVRVGGGCGVRIWAVLLQLIVLLEQELRAETCSLYKSEEEGGRGGGGGQVAVWMMGRWT